MKVVATLQADLEVTPLGTQSRLADELVGVPVLRRTVDRVASVERLQSIFVLCPAAQLQRCKDLLQGTRAVVRAYSVPPPPWASLVRTARKWSLDGWRGGIGGTTHFDEYTDARLIERLLQEEKADAALSAAPGAVLIDPTLIKRMIRQHEQNAEESHLTFTQAPPGLAGILLDAAILKELAQKNIPLGWVFSYKPDTPERDLIFQPCCCEIPVDLRYAAGRLVADTTRATARLEALLQDHEAPDLVTIGGWLHRRESSYLAPLPREVEIELTTDDPYPCALLRPRGSCQDGVAAGSVQTRGPMDLTLLERVVREVIRYDDSLIVLGGFGDPLRHPRFVTALQTIRSVQSHGGKLFGLAVRTAAVDLTDAHLDALIRYDVDILNVRLDAWSAKLYTRLQSPNDPSAADLDAVVNRLDRLAALQRERQTVKPIVVPEMTKARDNVHELDDFHDGWLRRVGAVTISGASHYAGQVKDRGVIRMAPSPREPCRRLTTRCVILADGRVTLCDQDFNGRQSIGRIQEQSLETIWGSRQYEHIREAHRQGCVDSLPLCAACDEWHRP